MPEITIVIGARPNFMKAASLIRALAATRLTPRVVHTGQHYDDAMSDIFLRQLGIAEPDAHLGAGSGSHSEQTARVLEAFEKYLANAPAPQRGVVVVGDVNSTLACAITAAKMRIPVAHVEAGLRSLARTMPEEINRLVTDAVSDLLFVSEPSGMRNLESEGVPAAKVHYVGNVMIDTLVRELGAAARLNTPGQFGLRPGGYALVTLHRPANVDEPERLRALAGFLLRVADELPVVFPMHPRTRIRLADAGLLERLASAPRITLAGPLGYRENLGLMQSAKVVLTDSGGIQEETSYLGVPCLTLRSNTERPVTITHGTNTLVGEDLDGACREISRVLAGNCRAGRPIDGWDGHAAERIAEVLDTCWSGCAAAAAANRRDDRAPVGRAPSPPAGPLAGLPPAKRLFDLALAMAALVVLGPLLLLTAVLVRLRLGPPVFFRQARIGLGERPFRIWKLRTMTQPAGAPLPDDLRLTSFGRRLRATSLDELPQLLNVLRGEMSLVGPRPLLPEYLPRYTQVQRRRHEVKPGITGWAQVNGRNSLTWERRFELDVWYVDHRSLRLDIRILWMTALRVLRRSHVSHETHATMPEFLRAAGQEQKA